MTGTGLPTPRRAPIDDGELLDRIRTFIADAADKPVDAVGPGTNIYVDLGVDSLGGACIFIDISYEFGMAEPETTETYVGLDTASKIVAWVRERERMHG